MMTRTAADKNNLVNDIAIVGISVFCPAGDSTEEFWNGIVTGGDFIIDAPDDVIESFYFDKQPNGVDQFYCRRGGFCKPLKVDPIRYGILPITAEGVDPDQLVSMAVSEFALADAGVFEKGISLQKCSIIIGKGNFAGLVALRSAEILHVAHQITEVLKETMPGLTEDDLAKIRQEYQSRQGRYQADMAIGTMPNLVASLVAKKFDMHGPAYTVDAACASGIVAINQSIHLLRSGQCDIAVAGGMHTGQNPMFWGAFDMLGAMSRKQRSAPFSEDADGLLIGQGGGFIVLKTLRKALEDGDRIYALIKETSICSDGAGSHVTVTTTQGQLRVLEQAWRLAGMDPQTIGYVEAHGTATPVGDRVEISTLKEFFGDDTAPRAFVGSIKSNIGHLMPAAGMIGVIKTALALYHRKIPPTLHCETPLPAMFETRFLPPQEAIDWDDEKYPLVAGVNAFGFGGINSHAILTAYDPPKISAARKKPYSYPGEALLVSAPDKNTLIAKLKAGDYTNTGGSYRLALFNPDEKRLERAIAIVERDKPWRSKLDTWFTNEPLLLAGGKIAFMFPGFGPTASIDTDSLSDALDISYMKELIAQHAPDTEPELHPTLEFQFLSQIGLESLRKLGIEADVYIGHSVGEWSALTYSGMTSSTDLRMLITTSRSGNVADYEKYPSVAVSGVSLRETRAWCDEIPGLYLANDNCPSQMVLCGERPAVETLIERLSNEKIFHTVLDYSIGLHTPLIGTGDVLGRDLIEQAKVREGHVPVWSAATLAPAPTETHAYMDLIDKQFTSPVYFRRLIEKLYDEVGVRVFVQVGSGALTGFVEDTLNSNPFGAVSTATDGRGGLDQMRRVLALLFIEGKEVNAKIMGVKPCYRVEHSLMTLPRGMRPLVRDMPAMRAIVQSRCQTAMPALAPSQINDPIWRAGQDNIKEAVNAQTEISQAFRKAAVTTPVYMPIKKSFTEPLSLRFEDHPYLVDHSIVRQPKGWDDYEDLNLVVPFTMTIELLAEIAVKHAPGRRLLKVAQVAAFRWIDLNHPFDENVKGEWKSQDVLELNLEGYAKAEFVFGAEFPMPPEALTGEIDIGASIMEPWTAAAYYDRYSFHGPLYHSNLQIIKVGSKGMLNLAEKQEGKGSLLDVMGQQLGLFLHLTRKENTISFPVRLKEIAFYENIFDQRGRFEHTLIITRMTDSVIVGDMVLKRDGRVWAVARDFTCQRFVNIIPVWNVILKPQKFTLADEVAPGVRFYTNDGPENVMTLLAKRYLNSRDREIYDGLKSQNKKREHLLGRIAVKDAVRAFAAHDDLLYPVEIDCVYDERGKLFVQGRRCDLSGVHVSLAHKDGAALAIAADAPVGIDLEKIEEKDEAFVQAVLTEQEITLIQRSPFKSEAFIRFWVGKEAVAKKTGVGILQGAKKYEVTAVDCDILTVAGERVRIIKIDSDYIGGWTI